MKRNQIQQPKMYTEVVSLDGGLNENVSSIEMKAGELISCKNYYITEGSTGGYVSLKGYERYDGQTKPSEAAYKILTADITGVLAVGDTIEGAPKEWVFDFNDGTTQGWYASGSGPVTNVSSQLNFYTTYLKGVGKASVQLDGLLVGEVYDVFFDYTYESASGASLQANVYDVGTSAYLVSSFTSSIASPRTNNKFSFTAASASAILTFQNTTSSSAYNQRIDNVSVRLATNLLGNGEACTKVATTGGTNTGNFTLGSGWSISTAGYISASAGAISTVTHNPSLAAVAAKTYELSIDVVRTAGSIEITFGGDTSGVINTTGTHVVTFNTINTDPFVITKDAAFAGQLDNIYLQLDPNPFTNPTATVVGIEDDYLIIVDDTATFGTSNLEVLGVVVGTCTGPQTSGSATIAPYAKGVASDYYRSLIDAVPGQGNILGICVYQGKTYVFRNKVGGLTAGMYVESAGGWTEIDTSSDDLEPDGNYSFLVYNFSGSSFSESLFWTNGVDAAGMYDGTTFSKIATGMVTDTPQFLAAHGDRLWLSFAGGSLQYSTLGDPTDWSTSAGEIGVGYEITGLTGSVGDTLVVFGYTHIKILEGSDTTTWTFKNFSDVVGAYPYTICKLFDTIIFMSDMGVTTLAAAQEYGDFSSNAISEKVKRTLFAYKSLLTCATVVRSLNQYRLYFSNGKGIIFSFFNKKLRGATLCEYPDPVRVVAEGRLTTGISVNYFAGLSNYVYQMDSGTSYDGAEMTHRFSTAYFHYKQPRYLKRFLRATFEIVAEDPSTFYIKPSFDYSMVGYPSGIKESISVATSGAVWGESEWGTMIWSGVDTTNRIFYDFLGIGGNMSITISFTSKYARQHTFQDFIVDYLMLGRQM